MGCPRQELARSDENNFLLHRQCCSVFGMLRKFQAFREKSRLQSCPGKADIDQSVLCSAGHKLSMCQQHRKPRVHRSSKRREKALIRLVEYLQLTSWTNRRLKVTYCIQRQLHLIFQLFKCFRLIGEWTLVHGLYIIYNIQLKQRNTQLFNYYTNYIQIMCQSSVPAAVPVYEFSALEMY